MNKPLKVIFIDYILIYRLSNDNSCVKQLLVTIYMKYFLKAQQ